MLGDDREVAHQPEVEVHTGTGGGGRGFTGHTTTVLVMRILHDGVRNGSWTRRSDGLLTRCCPAGREPAHRFQNREVSDMGKYDELPFRVPEGC
ncbi:hypothetical protein GCM10010185_15620 [Saccharothrix coeruleofusca]|uniref:Uncharacterized protein n=1 Tax=Saccharothrix coeruleofusca TaxID=33919 RepID=A0A918AJJ5_9PSEU|nr:hypothetical protein GCM10010185_15620 [Saccharothrix coeruleofusca]